MFEPEELMARIVDLEEQLKVSEMAPPAAEQLIACLEGEIAKRDEELAACRVAVENCDLFRARIAELEQDLAYFPSTVRSLAETVTEREAEINQLRAELAAINAQGVVMPEHETSTPSSKWASAGEPDPHGKAYDCERAELSMGEYTDDELANAVFMHDHRSFDIAATMRGEPGSIVLLTAAKDRIRWLSRSLDKALARLNADPVQQVSVPDERIIPTSAELIQWAWEEEPEETRFQEGYSAAKRWVKMQIEAGIAAPEAPAADALYEAVTPDVVEWLRCGLAANNRLVDGTHPALELVRAALAAHRAQGVV